MEGTLKSHQGYSTFSFLKIRPTTSWLWLAPYWNWLFRPTICAVKWVPSAFFTFQLLLHLSLTEPQLACLVYVLCWFELMLVHKPKWTLLTRYTNWQSKGIVLWYWCLFNSLLLLLPSSHHNYNFTIDVFWFENLKCQTKIYNSVIMISEFLWLLSSVWDGWRMKGFIQTSQWGGAIPSAYGSSFA